MFKKLLSNLPFNPSLIHQVTAYAEHLQTEVRLRRLGVLVLVVCLSIQIVPLVSLQHNGALPVILILVILTALALYCWLRARLLRKEIEVVRKDYGR